MIVVTGASGQLGRLVVHALLERGTPAAGIVAAVRQPARAADLAVLGVQVREADYERPATLDTAFAGARRVLLVSSSELGRRVPQHQAVIEAARRAGIDQLVYTSLLHAATSPLTEVAADHAATEAALAGSGLRHTVLRNGWYHENYHHAIGAGLERGVFIGASARGRIASAARADYAEAAAVVLTTPVAERQVIELAGDSAYTLDELARMAAELTGRPLAYQDLPPADYTQALIGVGVPAPFAALMANAEAGAARDGLFDDGRALSGLIGRPTTPVRDALARAFGPAARAGA